MSQKNKVANVLALLAQLNRMIHAQNVCVCVRCLG